MVDVLNLDCSGDHLRKVARGIYESYQNKQDKRESNISGDKIIEELDLKKQEIQKERLKPQATKIEYNRHQRLDSRFEMFYDNIRGAIDTLPVPKYKFYPSNIETPDKEYVLTFSDIHYGSSFESVNNSYSREICQQRFELLFQEMIHKIDSQDINTLKVINLGDTIQGILRISDLQLNEIPVVEAVVEISRLIANFLNELSAYSNIEYYHVPSANHSQTRNLGSKPNELAAEDMEKIIINYIHDLLRNNERIVVYKDYDRDYVAFDIFNFKCCALHGHQVKSIGTVLKDISMLHREWYDTVFLGHFHSGKELAVGEGLSNNTEVLLSPAFIGSCPYSDKLMVGGKSMCKLYEFDEKHGHVGTQNIVLN